MAKSAKQQNEEKLKKRREQKKMSMRRARAKLKNNPEKHEEVKRKDRERYRKKKEAGLVKSVNDLHRRDQKVLRKEWVNRAKRYRMKKKHEDELQKILEENSPPPSPIDGLTNLQNQQAVGAAGTKSRVSSGKKVARRNRYKWRKEKEKLLRQLENSIKRINKYKMRNQRLKKQLVKLKSTPEKNVDNVLQGQCVTPEVRRKLLFGEVLAKQVNTNFEHLANTPKLRKRMFSSVLHGKIVEKHKLSKSLYKLTSRRTFTLKSKRSSKEKSEKAKLMAIKFLEEDENSRLTAGKKETILLKWIESHYMKNGFLLYKFHS